MYRLVLNSPTASAAAAAATNLLKSRGASAITGSPKKTVIQALGNRATSTSSTTPAPISTTTNKSGEQQKQYSTSAEPFLNGSSSAYVEEMYNAWLQDPSSVHAVSPLSNEL